MTKAVEMNFPSGTPPTTPFQVSVPAQAASHSWVVSTSLGKPGKTNISMNYFKEACAFMYKVILSGVCHELNLRTMRTCSTSHLGLTQTRPVASAALSLNSDTYGNHSQYPCKMTQAGMSPSLLAKSFNRIAC